MDRRQLLIIHRFVYGTNYTYWKVHMKTFLQSLDENVQLAIEVGWTKPTDSLASWDDDKIKAANFNSKVLNALFSVVTNEEFKKISSIDTTFCTPYNSGPHSPMMVKF